MYHIVGCLWWGGLNRILVHVHVRTDRDGYKVRERLLCSAIG